MAAFFFVSQLLLIALLSWNVHCLPVKGWSQHGPYVGSFSNMAAPPGLHYSSSQGTPAQPSSVSYPAVSFPRGSVEEGVYSSTGTYPATSSPTPDRSNGAHWNAAPAWDPMEESASSYMVSRTSQPTSDFGLPPPPFYQAGELDEYEANLEYGNSERESEELRFPPPPPPPPYPDLGFQAGELSQYESIFEHGNEERETEEQGFLPPRPFASAPRRELPPFLGSDDPPSEECRELTPARSNMRYLFMTGQLPPGTYSHFQSDYEEGRDHWEESHYEKYDFPAQSPVMPTQNKQDYTKL